MKNAAWVFLLLLLGETLSFRALAQPGPDQAQLDRCVMILQASDSSPEAQMNAAWELGLMGPDAQKAVPALLATLANSEAPPIARMSALNALGHIGIAEEHVVQVRRILAENPTVFRGSGGTNVINGSFEIVADEGGARERGAFGETMFTLGSLHLTGWTTYLGILMIQDEGARPGGSNSLELAPRDVPGCASQTLSTTVGTSYELRFFTCSGRTFAGANHQLRVRVADVDRTIDCPPGEVSQLMKVPFQARSGLTTVTFCGLGSAGFGPMIDEVSVVAAVDRETMAPPEDLARLRQLDAMAQRIRRGFGTPSPAGQQSRAAPEAQAASGLDGFDLLAEEGQAFVGHQLDFFDTSEPGVLGTTRPAWISLYRTEGREFVFTGEVALAGPSEQMLFPNDLPDGFALFVREWDGLQRYQLDSRQVIAKRRLLHGQRALGIISVVEFAPAPSEEWIPFKVHASESLIEYSLGDNVARLPGPLDTDGANKVAIAPGTRLRNLRLRVFDAARAQPHLPAREPDGRPGAAPAAEREQPSAARHGPELDGRLPRMLAESGVPEGEYQVHLEWWNQQQTLRVRVKGGAAEVVQSSEPKLEGVRGVFQPLANGASYIFLRSEAEGFGGQIWTPQPDGSYEIKEIPDRGEKQRAVPPQQNL